MHETKRVRFTVLAGLASFAMSFAVGACFNGFDSEGLPCDDASQCGAGMDCSEGYCNGVFACDGASEFVEAGAVCDGFADCPDAEDEDFALCIGEGVELFECDDGETSIPLAWRCDELDDCPDGEDEAGCAGVDANMCGEGGPDIAYEAEDLVSLALMNPLRVEVFDFFGSPDTAEIVTGSAGGTELQVVTVDADGDTMSVPFAAVASGTIADFGVGDVDGDNKLDVVVVTESSEGLAAVIYRNDAPSTPVSYGAPVAALLDGQAPTVQALGLGSLDDDNNVDMIAVVDGGGVTGRLMVARGDTAAADGGGSYFTPVALDVIPALGYTTFFDAAVADFTGNDGLSDIVVSGMLDGMPRLWLIARSDGDLLTAWQAPTEIPAMIPGAQLAVGSLRGPGADLVLADPLSNQLLAIRNLNGMLVPGSIIEVAGGEPIGITVSDINCDDDGDLLFYQGDAISVLLGDGEGGVLSADPIETEIDGSGRGSIGIGEFNDDGTADLIGTIGGSGVQLVLSTGSTIDEPDEPDESEGEGD